MLRLKVDSEVISKTSMIKYQVEFSCLNLFSLLVCMHTLKYLCTFSIYLQEICQLRGNFCVAQIRTILQVLKAYVSVLCHFVNIKKMIENKYLVICGVQNLLRNMYLFKDTLVISFDFVSEWREKRGLFFGSDSQIVHSCPNFFLP